MLYLMLFGPTHQCKGLSYAQIKKLFFNTGQLLVLQPRQLVASQLGYLNSQNECQHDTIAAATRSACGAGVPRSNGVSARLD